MFYFKRYDIIILRCSMKVRIGVSNRHVHLCEEDYKLLFGELEFEKKVDLNQPGEFASVLTVSLKGTKGEIDNVRVLGPLRSYTQVEISKTDSYKLGVNPPIRTSGELSDAEMITIIGPMGEVVKNSCIIANRHLHVDKEIIKEYKLEGVKSVDLRVSGEKSGILEKVYLKETPKAYFEVHLDTDDANAFLLKQNDEVEIIHFY